MRAAAVSYEQLLRYDPAESRRSHNPCVATSSSAPPLERVGTQEGLVTSKQELALLPCESLPRGVDDGKLDHSGRIELRLILVDAWYRSYA